MNSVDFGRAFTYVFQDRDWIKKVLIGGLFVPLIIFFFIGLFILTGYMVEIVRRVMSGQDTPLPEWDDIGGYLSRGFVAAVGLLIWHIPYIIFACCLGIVLGFGDTSTDFSAGNFFGNQVTSWIGTAYSAIVGPAVIGRYAMKQQFNAMFEFNEIIAGIQRVGAGIIMIFLILFVGSIVASLGIIALCIGFFFTTAYYVMVSGHAYGQGARIAYGGTPAPTTEDRPAF